MNDVPPASGYTALTTAFAQPTLPHPHSLDRKAEEETKKTTNSHEVTMRIHDENEVGTTQHKHIQYRQLHGYATNT